MSGRRAVLTASSLLRAAPGVVWKRVTSPAGINQELRPLMRMTVPAGLEEGLDGDAVRVGERLGRSWILLGGVVPFDYDDLRLVELEPGRRFLERSTMLSQRLWEHERTVEPADGGCRVTDRVAWEPRLPLPAALLRPLFRGIFRHRHRRLRREFGDAGAQ